MKNLTLIILVILSVISFKATAQKKKALEKIDIPEMAVDEETNYIIYKEVVQQEGSKTVLYDKAIAWATKFYKSPSNVLREKDKEGGKLMARHRFYIFDKDSKSGVKSRADMIEYTLTFLFKDGRYKYEITKINRKSTSYQGIERWYTDNKKQYNHRSAGYLVQVNDKITELIKSFKVGIAKKDKVEEEW